MVNALTVVSVPSCWPPGPVLVEFCRTPQQRVKRSHQPACPQPTLCFQPAAPNTNHHPSIPERYSWPPRSAKSSTGKPRMLAALAGPLSDTRSPCRHLAHPCSIPWLWVPQRYGIDLFGVRRCGNEFFHADPSLVTASSLYRRVYFRPRSLSGFHCPVSVVQHLNLPGSTRTDARLPNLAGG